jgi:hypothetical protein
MKEKLRRPKQEVEKTKTPADMPDHLACRLSVLQALVAKKGLRKAMWEKEKKICFSEMIQSLH